MSLSATQLRRLSGLLDEVLDLPEHERAAWLQARADLPDAIRQGLRELIDHAGQPAALPSLPRYADAVAADAEIEAGDEVGGYRLLRPLGRGGMATVWLAERSDGALKRPVALKLPLGTHSRGRLAERFARERDILATLVHPHIARLYDAGFGADGRPFLALEYVQGSTLTAWCRQRALGLVERLRLFLQVLAAIQHAHGQLVVHRDLKPANILVTDDGEVRLLDFGIAKLLEGAPAGEAPATELGGVALTPQYAAPEQILNRPVGITTDIYALGLVLHELLVGTLPYRLKRETRGALEDAIVEAEPLPPSLAARGVQAWAARLAGDLDTIVLKALKKDPAARYATAAAFADDIERHLKGEPVLARPDSLGYRASRFLRRHRWSAAAAASAALALAGATAVAVWQARVARQEARAAQAAENFMTQLFLTNSVLVPDPRRARETTARELLDLGARSIDGALTDAPEARLRMLTLFGQLYTQLAERDTALRFLEQAARAARELHGADSDALLLALADLSAALRDVSVDHPRLPQVLAETEGILERRGDRDSLHRATWWLMRADWLADRALADALAAARQGMLLWQRHADEPALPHWVAKAVRIAWLAGEYGDARAWSAFAIPIAERQSEAGEMTARRMLPSLQFGLALSLAALNESAAAEDGLRRAVQAAERIDDAEFALRARIQLADLLLRSGRPGGDALLRAAQAQAAQRQAANGRLPFSIQACLGRAWLAGGDPQAALVPLAAARAARSLDNPSPAMAELLRDQAEALAAVGRLDEAAEALGQARHMRERLRSRSIPVLRDEAMAEARLLLARGQPGLAAGRLEPFTSEAHGLSAAGLALQVLRVQALRDACEQPSARAAAERARRALEASPQRGHLVAGEAALARAEGALEAPPPAPCPAPAPSG